MIKERDYIVKNYDKIKGDIEKFKDFDDFCMNNICSSCVLCEIESKCKEAFEDCKEVIEEFKAQNEDSKDIKVPNFGKDYFTICMKSGRSYNIDIKQFCKCYEVFINFKTDMTTIKSISDYIFRSNIIDVIDVDLNFVSIVCSEVSEVKVKF